MTGNDIYNFIINMTAIFSGFAINYMATAKASNKRMKVIYSFMESLRYSREYERKISDSLTNKTLSVFTSHDDLDRNIKAIMTVTSTKIRSFALKYAECNVRKNRNNIKEFLINEAASIQMQVRNEANTLFVGKKNNMRFGEFVNSQSDLDYYIKEFINKLIKNGMSEDEYIKTFEDFLLIILKAQIKGYKLWKS